MGTSNVKLSSLVYLFAIGFVPSLFAAEASPAEVLEFVAQSPLYVYQHDRSAWLELFDENATLQDPVGSPVLQHAKNADDPFSRFYEVFIAANTIEFRPRQDYVDSYEVMRDVTIHTAMSESCAIDVEAFIYYQVKEGEDGLLIEEMRAYWELGQNLKAVASQGLKCVGPSLALSGRMLKELGAGFALKYSGALKSVGDKGKSALEKLELALANQDYGQYMKLFADAASIDCGEDRALLDTESFWNYVQSKSVRWELKSKKVSAGRETLSQALIHNQDSVQPAVIKAEFESNSDRIIKLKCFQNLQP